MSARLLASLAAALATPALLCAQLPVLGRSTPHVGIMAGINSSTFGGSDVDSPDHRTGFLGGLYATLPVGIPSFALRPELLYSQKGVKNTDQGLSATIKLDYIEVPVLFQVAIPAGPGIRPLVYAGPSFAFKASCRVEASQGGQSLSSGCTNPDADIELGVKSFDVGGVVGGQLNFGLAGRAVGVGVRYTYGFTDLTDNGSVKNRVLSVYGALELPFGR